MFLKKLKQLLITLNKVTTKPRKKISSNVKLKIRQIAYLVFFLFVIFALIGPQWINIIFEGTYSKWVSGVGDVIFKKSSDKNTILNGLMTADGLLTTSTFAFIAFSSISPTSSGSSLVMNRLSWDYRKNNPIYWFHIRDLLIITVLITLSNTFALIFNPMLLIWGSSISALILILVIIRYIKFNRDPNKNATISLMKKVKYLYKMPVTQNTSRKYRKITRPFLNPLRETRNRDILRELVSNKTTIDIFKTEQNKQNSIGLTETSTCSSLFAAKIRELIIYNKNISDDTKIFLLVKLLLGISERKNETQIKHMNEFSAVGFSHLFEEIKKHQKTTNQKTISQKNYTNKINEAINLSKSQ